MRKNVLNKWSWLAVLALLIVINILAAKWHGRADLTNDKRFTLSSSTEKLLSKTDTPVHVQVFLKGDYPSAFRQLAGSTEDLLRNFQNYTGNKLSYTFISPEENFPGSNSTYGDTLVASGLMPINLTAQVKQGQQQQNVFPYAIVTRGDRSVPVTLYRGKSRAIVSSELHESETLLEYEFANAIAKLSSDKKPVVGYATGNNEPMDITTYDLVENILKPDYQLFTFNLQSSPVIPAEMNALMVVKPRAEFSEAEKLKLDQYLLSGGNVIVFLDKLDAEFDSLKAGEVIAYDRNLRLDDLFFKYGARVNPDLLMDLQCDFLPFDVNGDGQFEFLPWNYFPVMQSPDNHPINKNLGYVAGRFVNTIDTVEAEGIKKTVLLTSSANARNISGPALISGRENSIAPEDKKFNKKHLATAVLLEGNFTSLYANRATQAMRDSLAAAGKQFLAGGIKPGKLILVADGDLPLNNTSKGQPLPMGMNPFTIGSEHQFPFANETFVQNALQYLTDQYGLVEARNKDYKVKLLDPKKTEAERSSMQLINILLPVLVIALFGLIFMYLRKRKYTSNK